MIIYPLPIGDELSFLKLVKYMVQSFDLIALQISCTIKTPVKFALNFLSNEFTFNSTLTVSN
jgi:hypothetical protein